MSGWVIRIGIGLGAILLTIVLIIAGWLASRFYLTLPQTQGTVEIEGYNGSASVVRDENGVAHIFGETDADVYFALGYTHASERFFQMDLARRSLQGRLSELFGERAIRIDGRARIRRYHLTAQASLENASAETRQVLNAYTAGVNARLAKGTPSPEYAILRVPVEPWTALDTSTMGILMADMLAAGGQSDWAREALSEVLTPAQMTTFLAEIPDWAPTELKDEDVAPQFSNVQTQALPLPDALDPVEEDDAGSDEASENLAEPDNPPGSNAWIVSGDRTVTGAPLLASDPHLGLGAPSIWYHARLNLSDGPVIGVTSPGSPFVIMGRNDHGAWAYTNTGFDVIDYVPRDRSTIDTRMRTEIIEVNGDDPVELIVEDTPEGPVLDPRYFDLRPYDPDSAVVLRSTVHDPSNDMMDVALGIMKAENFEGFVEAARNWTAPMQNMHYAGVDGTIGYTTAGLMPIRDENGDWTGYIPYDELPRVSNPADGIIVSGNNPVAPPSYPYDLPGRYSVYRAATIEGLLQTYELHTQETFRSIQMDVTSLQALQILPTLLGARPESQMGIEALARLERWDGTLSAQGPEGLIYSAWVRTLAGMIWSDELGEWAPDFAFEQRVFIAEVLTGDAYQWCDDVRTTARESCAMTAGLALDFAVLDLESRYGRNMDDWDWGVAHQALFDHPAMTGLPILGESFTVRTPVGGDGATINVGHFSYANDNFDSVHGPSMRAIYDLADLNRSLYMHAPGQSGHPWSKQYRNLAEPWASGEYYEIRDDWRVESRPEGARVLRLVAAPAGE